MISEFSALVLGPNGNTPTGELSSQAKEGQDGSWRFHEATRPSDADLRDFIETVGIGLHCIEPNGIILWANEADYRLLGYTREEYVGHHIAEFHAEKRVINDILARLGRGEAVRDYAARLRSKGGSIRDVVINCNARFEDGRFIHARCLTQDVPEERRASAQLREGEQRFREMIDALPVAIYTTDAEGRLTHFNPAAIAFSGRVPELGKDQWCVSWKLFRPDGTPMRHDECPMAVALREGRIVCDQEAIAERPDGKRIWFVPYPTPLRDAKGRIVAGINMLMDVTERKQTEEAVHQRTVQFETLLNEAPLGVYLVDADFHIRHVNPTARAVFGKIPDVVGCDFDEVIHALWPRAYANEIVNIFHRTLETGEPHIVRERIEEWLDRDVHDYYEWQTTRIPLPEGRFGVVCYFRDISEQVSARHAIAESEERFRFMAESMPQKIFSANAQGNIDYVNQQWIDFTGLSFDKICGSEWDQFIHADDVEEHLRLWKHSLDTGEPFKFSHRCRRSDGVYRWHLTSALAMRDASGKISMWVGSSTDIHEQKETEENLRRANEDLKQFAFAASHDLQEPLRMITTYSELLFSSYDGQLDDNASLCVDVVTEATKRMRDLLADLLSFTELGADPENGHESTDLNTVFQTVTQSLKRTVEDTGAVLTSGELPVVRGQPAHFVQLLHNLLSNAIKYRGESPPQVHLSAEQQGSEWRFAVADNGIGIEPKFHQTIFAVFKRLHGKTIPGTGIGLAICQRVVERYGGRVWVDSQVGRGATFYFTLPREAEDLAKQRSAPD